MFTQAPKTTNNHHNISEKHDNTKAVEHNSGQRRLPYNFLLTQENILQLQKTIGNRAVIQLLKSNFRQQPTDLPIQRMEPEENEIDAEPDDAIQMAGDLEDEDEIQMKQENSTVQIAPGQEKHLPHEGWHVVQQMQGRGDVIQRAIGFEMQTTMPVRRETGIPFGYKTLIYEDKRINPFKDSFYKITVDSDDVLIPQKEQPEPMEVLEFELPPIDDESAMKRTAGRMEIMRIALNNATQAATHTAAIKDVITNYEGLLTTKFPQGSGEEHYDAIERNKGINQTDAIVGLEGGNWQHHMAVRPQATFGVLLENLSSALTAILSDVSLVKDNSVRKGLIELIKEIKENSPAKGKLLGLITLVEVYLALMGNETKFDFPKDAAPFMARTDFHSMFNTLSKEEQSDWSNKYVEGNKESNIGKTVFGGGFAQSSGGVSKGPNRHAWMISIANPGDKDSAYANYLVKYVQAGLVEDLKYILQKLNQNGELENAFKSEETTPQKELAMSGFNKLTKNLVPQPKEMHAMVELVKKQEYDDVVDGAYIKANQDLTKPTKDLMSMGPVTRRVGSMGSMTVKTDGSSKEKDMAILENRFMPDWDSASNPKDDIKWDERLIVTFKKLQEILGKK